MIDVEVLRRAATHLRGPYEFRVGVGPMGPPVPEALAEPLAEWLEASAALCAGSRLRDVDGACRHKLEGET